MFKPGDFVLGAFANKNGSLLRHYSVVLTGNAEGALVIYCTSLKEHSASAQVFSAEDMSLANMTTKGRWDASTVSLVPNETIQKMGRISAKTLAAITVAYAAASKQRIVSAAMLHANGKVVSL